MKEMSLRLIPLVWLAASGCVAGGEDDEPAADLEQEIAANGFEIVPRYMSLSIATGGDDLRSSSVAYFSVLRGDGTWSTEYPIIVGGASAWSTTNVVISSTAWDGYDFCARAFQLRLQQGSCFLCTGDNWDVASLAVSLTDIFDPQGGTHTLISRGGIGRLTESGPTVQATATAVPPGTRCRNSNLTADCLGALVDTATAAAWEHDSYCDNGAYGMNLVCGAFEHDDGACGIPSPWSCPITYYRGGAADGCDCNCGAWDPDCNDPTVNVGTRTVYGCPAGNTCTNRQISPGVFAPTCVAPVR